MVTGAQWNQLPEHYGKWNSIYRFHLRWAKKAVFEDLLKITAKSLNKDDFKIIDGSHIKVHQDACHNASTYEEQGFGKTKGGRNTKINAVTNGAGKLLNFVLIPGNHCEQKSAMEALGDLRDKIVLADKGYDSDEFRSEIRQGGAVPNIPGRKNRKRAVFYIKEVGKRRHVVENYFCRMKRHRRISTRYDRLPETFKSFVFLASIWDWLS